MNRSLKDSFKETFFSELHSLLSSGLDFSHAFLLLIEGQSDKNLRAALQNIYGQIVSGSSLWQALVASDRFSPLDSGVVRIGEETGRLSDALSFLTDYYHKRIEQLRMISSSVSYPSIIMVMAICVVVFMMVVIVPMFEQVYSRMGGKLPSMTLWIIDLSKKFPSYATLALILLAVGGALLYYSRENPAVRAASSKVVMSVPILGKIFCKHNEASFCKLLHLLTSSGIPLLSGITMLRSIIRFYPYQCSLKAIAEGLEKGELFAMCLEKFPHLYERRLITLLRVGEETGRLPQMLAKQGEDLSHELEHRLRGLGNFLEPVMILFVGALVAVILISMYLPMFKLGGIMG